jgi:hypothetical protein
MKPEERIEIEQEIKEIKEKLKLMDIENDFWRIQSFLAGKTL